MIKYFKIFRNFVLKSKKSFYNLNIFSQYLIELIPFTFAAVFSFRLFFYCMPLFIGGEYLSRLKAAESFISQCVFAIPAVLFLCALLCEYIIKREEK